MKAISAGYIQFDVVKADVEANFGAVERILSNNKPKGPGIIVLPELWATGFAYEKLPNLADHLEDILDRTQKLSQKYGIHLAGSLPEKETKGNDNFVYNTLFITSPKKTIGKYRKQQMFTFMQEDKYFLAGDNPKAIDTEIGKIASIVCFDLRFPELASRQAGEGADLLIISAQWPDARVENWRALALARATENQIFTIACNRCGTTDDISFGGHSAIIAPDGTRVDEAGYDEKFCYVKIDGQLQKTIRSRFMTVGKTPYRFNDSMKVLSLDELVKIREENRKLERKTVFTNGCFDILHAGHVTYLEKARQLGDCLIIGLNTDNSIKNIKGPDRPINDQQDRARVLAGLGCVDYVVLFDDETPHDLIKTLLPDVLVKGADWAVEDIVGGREVMDAGGKVVTIPFVDGKSTTGVIEKAVKNSMQ